MTYLGRSKGLCSQGTAPVSQGQGLNPGKSDFYFSGFLSATAFLTNLTARIFSTYVLNSRVFKTQMLRQHLEKREEQIPITQTIFPDLLPLPCLMFVSNPVHMVDEV